MPLCFDFSDLWQTHTFPKCTHAHTATHTRTNKTPLLTFVYMYNFCNSLTHAYTHRAWKQPYRQTLMRPQTPLIKTNSSHAPTSPRQNPPYHILLSFLPPPASPHPSYLALCDCWAAQGPTVIGLDIIYWPLGNVAFQHLIKIISSHSNGRYGLKGSHCNHLDTRRGSCSLSLRSVLLLPLVSVVLFLPRMINT